MIALSAIFVIFAGCHQYDNFTTYYNTYYNAQRLLYETEDEFEFQRIVKKKYPRIFIPDSLILFQNTDESGAPPFLQSFIIPRKMLQPVKVKLDSIIIKGSKIMAQHPKSDYIQGTLYLMANAFFYKNEWLPAETKCMELIEKYPDGEWSPDAHLLLAEAQLIQRKFRMGRNTLSRTVDIAWQLKRYDILSEAFNMEAELSLYENDLDGALQPYLNAIAQVDDDEIKAQWQTDLAILLYRMGRFSEAEKQFAITQRYSPGYVVEFESYLYRAISLGRLGRYDEATKILDRLENDGNNEEWLDYVMAGRMNLLRAKGELIESGPVEKYADSTFMNKPAIHAVYFECGMNMFENHDYTGAKRYFGRIRSMRTQFRKTAKKMYSLLDDWYKLRGKALPTLQLIYDGEEVSDSAKIVLAGNLFSLGRIHDQLGNTDSSFFYYKTASDVSPKKNIKSAKYVYVYARMMEDKDFLTADSLYDYVVKRYPYTDYATDAAIRQGYGKDHIIHPAKKMYISAYDFKMRKSYDTCVYKFWKIYKKYPKTDYAPRSLYAIGWTFEKDLHNLDTALFYYNILLEEYPNSIYARDLHTSIDYLLALKKGGPLPDSLKPIVKKARKKIDFKRPEKPKKQPNNKPSGSMNPMDLFDNPGKILENVKPSKILDDTKKNLLNPENFKPNIKLPENPLDKNKKSNDKDTTKKG